VLPFTATPLQQLVFESVSSMPPAGMQESEGGYLPCEHWRAERSSFSSDLHPEV
jgi:hypothetical protein